jgi:hypothetical protein
MPKSTVKEEDPYPIPLDTLVPLRLESVEFVSIDYTVKSGPNAGKPGKFNKWEWTFGVYDGEYTGLTVRGNSEPRITSLEERTGSLHLARPWVEALLGRELALGEEIDTDDLIGLAGVGTVEHLPPRPKKDGGGSWFNVALDELFPAGSMGQAVPSADPWGAAQAVAPDQPPF